MKQMNRPESGCSGHVRWSRVYPLPDSAAAKPIAGGLMAGVIPASMLQQDEIILLLIKPSLWFILLTSIRSILIIGLVGVFVVQAFDLQPSSYVTPQTVATLVTLIAVGRLVWMVCVWTSHIYLLTNQRIVTIKGVLNVTIYQAHLRKIQQSTMRRLLIERILGLGTMGFATAAAAGGPESTWVMIPHPLETQQQVIAAIQKASGGGEGGLGGVGGVG